MTCNFLEKRLQHILTGFCEYCEIIKNTYFEEHLPFWFLKLTTSDQSLISTKLKRLITHSFLFDKLSPFMSFIAAETISKIHFSKQAIRNFCDIVMQLFPMKKVKISIYNPHLNTFLLEKYFIIWIKFLTFHVILQ